jgi:hypothetical protein
MKIHYVEDKSGNKLFSFFRHNFNQAEDGTFIDGGFDYIRTNAEVKYGEISELIKDIREQFLWINILNKDNSVKTQPSIKLLKELDRNHIINILIYFTNSLTEETKLTTSWITIHSIFLEELKYKKFKHEIPNTI